VNWYAQTDLQRGSPGERGPFRGWLEVAREMSWGESEGPREGDEQVQTPRLGTPMCMCTCMCVFFSLVNDTSTIRQTWHVSGGVCHACFLYVCMHIYRHVHKDMHVYECTYTHQKKYIRTYM